MDNDWLPQAKDELGNDKIAYHLLIVVLYFYQIKLKASLPPLVA